MPIAYDYLWKKDKKFDVRDSWQGNSKSTRIGA